MGGKRYIDIRSNGRGVIGRVYLEGTSGSDPLNVFRGSTRAHMLKKLKKVFPGAASTSFNKRGVTYF